MIWISSQLLRNFRSDLEFNHNQSVYSGLFAVTFTWCEQRLLLDSSLCPVCLTGTFLLIETEGSALFFKVWLYYLWRLFKNWFTVCIKVCLVLFENKSVFKPHRKSSCVCSFSGASSSHLRTRVTKGKALIAFRKEEKKITIIYSEKYVTPCLYSTSINAQRHAESRWNGHRPVVGARCYCKTTEE